MNEYNDTHENPTPDDLRGIESALDRLGAAERASAPDALEARTLEAVRRELDQPARAIPMHRHRAGVRTRVFARLGAAAAVLAVVGGAWFALRVSEAPTPQNDASIRLASLEGSVEDLFAFEEWFDEMPSVDTTAAQDEADELDSLIGSPWELIDTIDAAIGEEAI